MKCPICHKEISFLNWLKNEYKCKSCLEKRKKDIKKRDIKIIKEANEETTWECETCTAEFNTKKDCLHHEKTCDGIDRSDKLYGIGGWLALFILVLTFSIIVNLIFAIQDFQYVVKMSEELGSSFYWFLPLDIVFWMGVIGFTGYSAWSLTKLKPNAVYVSKITIILILASNFLGYIMSLIFSQSNEVYIDVSGAERMFISSVIFAVIWLSYLSVSKRVKKTWPLKKRKFYQIDRTLFFVMLAIIILFNFFIYGGLQFEESIYVDEMEVGCNNYCWDFHEFTFEYFYYEPTDGYSYICRCLDVNNELLGTTTLEIDFLDR